MSRWNNVVDDLLQSKKKKRNDHYLGEFVMAKNDLFSSDEEDDDDDNDDSDDGDDYGLPVPTQTAEL